MAGIFPGDAIDINLSQLRSWYSRPSQMRLVHSARQKTDFATGLTAALGSIDLSIRIDFVSNTTGDDDGIVPLGGRWHVDGGTRG